MFAVACLSWSASAGTFVTQPAVAPVARVTSLRSAVMSTDVGLGRRKLIKQGCAATAAAAGALPQVVSAKGSGWQQVDLPIATESPILFDIDFDPQNPSNGWIVGNKGTFLQTKDGGKTWSAKSFANLDPDEEINYRFTKMSFLNGEGWIIGKPAILLHTKDSGNSWERVPLSPKLPGDPFGIVALGAGQAEMSTSAGAIYTTDNAGRNWKAQVRETIDATLNRVSSSGVQACRPGPTAATATVSEHYSRPFLMFDNLAPCRRRCQSHLCQGASYFAGSVNSILRDGAGSYLAVSSRGNFYLTFTPGDEFWVPHNRQTSRRITSMGFALPFG